MALHSPLDQEYSESPNDLDRRDQPANFTKVRNILQNTGLAYSKGCLAGLQVKIIDWGSSVQLTGQYYSNINVYVMGWLIGDHDHYVY